MTSWITPPAVGPNFYPDSDGKPMAENTKQFRWILVLYCDIAALFRERPDVFVAGDLLWYPVEGERENRQAPDVMVVFGRPKGDRGSYQQWLEDGVAPQVVFEVLSPGNTYEEMIAKQNWYEEHGVEEYYVYSPDHNTLHIYLRRGDYFLRQRQAHGWVSPRLGMRFDFSEAEMVVYRPDGRRCLNYEELMTSYLTTEKAREAVATRAAQAEQRAEQERQRAEQAEQRAKQERQRAERLAEQLRQLGINPDL